MSDPDFPWEWIGYQGVGQFPMTQTQYDWLKAHDMTRDQYMIRLEQRKKENPCG